MSEPVIVTMRHVRKARMCRRGTRDFFVRHGIDWNRFLDDGVPAERLEETGDEMAIQLAGVARGR